MARKSLITMCSLMTCLFFVQLHLPLGAQQSLPTSQSRSANQTVTAADQVDCLGCEAGKCTSCNPDKDAKLTECDGPCCNPGRDSLQCHDLQCDDSNCPHCASNNKNSLDGEPQTSGLAGLAGQVVDAIPTGTVSDSSDGSTSKKRRKPLLLSTPAITTSNSATNLVQSNAVLADARRRLAKQLSEYLTEKPRDTQHVHQVITMALELTAHNAHLTGLAARTEAKHKNLPNAWKSGPLHQAKIPSSFQQTTNDFMRTQREMREAVSQMQMDIAQLSQSIHSLRKQAETAGDPPIRRMVWGSQSAQNYPLTDDLSVNQLKHRIRYLEHQLQRPNPQDERKHADVEFGNAARGNEAYASREHNNVERSNVDRSNVNHRQLNPRPIEQGPVKHAWHSIPLRPLNQSPEPLEPIQNNIRPLYPISTSLPAYQPGLIVRSYYVADLLAPPFPTSVAQLVQTLKAQVDPESWKHGSIEVAGPAVSLVIAQTPANHDRIVGLLRSFNRDTSWVTRPDFKATHLRDAPNHSTARKK